MMLKSMRITGLSLLAVIGVAMFLAFNASSDGEEPQAEITKQKARASAVNFMHRQFGLNVVHSFIVFQSHTRLSGYLQKERLEQRFNQAFPDFAIDYYAVELSGSGGDRYTVDVNMQSGLVQGWKRSQAHPGSSSRAERKQAEYWLSAMGYDPASFDGEMNESSGEWVFKDNGRKVGEAVLAVHIAVSDGKVSSFQPEFELPASFERWMDGQDRSAQRMGTGSMLISLALAIAAIVMAAIYRGTASFRKGTVLTAVFVAAYALNNINMYPGFKSMSISSWESLFNVLIMHFTIFLMAAAVYLSLVAGDAMWVGWGKAKWAAWSDPDFGGKALAAMVRGYLLCLFLLGVQAGLFSFAERYFDMWAVEDPTDSTYNNLWPALFPIMAWAAAISEEAIYRMFGIALCKKLVRNTFLAVLIPSFFWALGHTTYPVYPVYTRLVEVTILGVIFGYAYLKYGFMTTLFAHAAMDSILMGSGLFYTGGAADAATGVLYILSPALVGLAIYALHGRLRKDRLPPRPEAIP